MRCLEEMEPARWARARERGEAWGRVEGDRARPNKGRAKAGAWVAVRAEVRAEDRVEAGAGAEAGPRETGEWQETGFCGRRERRR